MLRCLGQGRYNTIVNTTRTNIHYCRQSWNGEYLSRVISYIYWWFVDVKSTVELAGSWPVIKSNGWFKATSQKNNNIESDIYMMSCCVVSQLVFCCVM